MALGNLGIRGLKCKANLRVGEKSRGWVLYPVQWASPCPGHFFRGSRLGICKASVRVCEAPRKPVLRSRLLRYPCVLIFVVFV